AERSDEGDFEEAPRDTQHDHHLNGADADESHDLAEHDLEGRRRHGEQVLHRPALDLAGQSHRRHHHHRHLKDDAEKAGHDIVLGYALGIVAAMDDDLQVGYGLIIGHRQPL